MKVTKALSLLILSFLEPSGVQATSNRSNIPRVEKLHRHAYPISGRFIVVLKDETIQTKASMHQAATTAQEISSKYRGSVRHVFRHSVNGFALDISSKMAKEMSSDPRVAFVEEDALFWASDNDNTPVAGSWGLDRIDQRDLPLDRLFKGPGSGLGVHVYVLDTGIRTSHEEFGGRASVAFDAINGEEREEDCNGHGTHVAATIGGINYGVAKGVSLHSVRVLDCDGSGTISQIIAGVDWITANHIGPSIANMSLGGSESVALDQAIKKSIRSGVTYVVAAGNESEDACFTSPARIPEVITVGASTSVDKVADFSNYGRCVDLFAPGFKIRSAWGLSDRATRTLNGTSMAAPHVAGVAALFLQSNRQSAPAAVASSLAKTATAGKLSKLEAGSPNLLLSSILEGIEPTPPPQPPAQPPSAPCENCKSYSGSLSGSNDSSIEPKGTYYISRKYGFHQGWLSGPAGYSFGLNLFRWNGFRWSLVKEVRQMQLNQPLSYYGSPGYYVWEVVSVRGGGTYQLWLKTPANRSSF